MRYQLVRTSPYLGGQIRLDIPLDSRYEEGEHVLRTNGLHVVPLNDNIPFRQDNSRDCLKYSHGQNIMNLYGQIGEQLFSADGEYSTLHWLHNGEDLVDPYSHIYTMGARRIRYQRYNKQFSFLCPLWISEYTDPSKLFFVISVRSVDMERDHIARAIIRLDSRIVEYLKDWWGKSATYINPDPSQTPEVQEEWQGVTDSLLNIKFDPDQAWITGVDVTNGLYMVKNVGHVVSDILRAEQPLMEFDNMLLALFRTEHMVAQQLLNLNFLFNFEDISWELKSELQGRPITITMQVGYGAVEDWGILPLKDFYTDYNHIPVFRADQQAFSASNATVVDYMGDNKMFNYVNANKFTQPIFHWTMVENPKYIYNFYDGFAPVFREAGGTEFQRISGRYFNQADLSCPDHNAFNSAAYWCNWHDMTDVPYVYLWQEFATQTNMYTDFSEYSDLIINWDTMIAYLNNNRFDLNRMNPDMVERFRAKAGDRKIWFNNIKLPVGQNYGSNQDWQDNYEQHLAQERITEVYVPQEQLSDTYTGPWFTRQSRVNVLDQDLRPQMPIYNPVNLQPGDPNWPAEVFGKVEVPGTWNWYALSDTDNQWVNTWQALTDNCSTLEAYSPGAPTSLDLQYRWGQPGIGYWLHDPNNTQPVTLNDLDTLIADLQGIRAQICEVAGPEHSQEAQLINTLARYNQEYSDLNSRQAQLFNDLKTTFGFNGQNQVQVNFMKQTTDINNQVVWVRYTWLIDPQDGMDGNIFEGTQYVQGTTVLEYQDSDGLIDMIFKGTLYKLLNSDPDDNTWEHVDLEDPDVLEQAMSEVRHHYAILSIPGYWIPEAYQRIGYELSNWSDLITWMQENEDTTIPYPQGEWFLDPDHTSSINLAMAMANDAAAAVVVGYLDSSLEYYQGLRTQLQEQIDLVTLVLYSYLRDARDLLGVTQGEDGLKVIVADCNLFEGDNNRPDVVFSIINGDISNATLYRVADYVRNHGADNILWWWDENTYDPTQPPVFDDELCEVVFGFLASMFDCWIKPYRIDFDRTVITSGVDYRIDGEKPEELYAWHQEQHNTIYRYTGRLIPMFVDPDQEDDLFKNYNYRYRQWLNVNTPEYQKYNRQVASGKDPLYPSIGYYCFDEEPDTMHVPGWYASHNWEWEIQWKNDGVLIEMPEIYEANTPALEQENYSETLEEDHLWVLLYDYIAFLLQRTGLTVWMKHKLKELYEISYNFDYESPTSLRVIYKVKFKLR